MNDFLKKLNIFRALPPASAIVTAFLAAILTGSILLAMPFATKAPGGIGYINALFTSTSAVCVTGLVVADTASTWSVFGQTVILILIQLGGLGIMTAASVFSLVTGKKMGLKERLTIRESLSEFKIQGVVKLFRYIIIATFSIEAVGALILSFKFVPAFGFWNGLAKSVFHSISAFCNAGFDIMGTTEAPFVSLTGFNNSFLVMTTISLLFIAGGLGFVVWNDIVTVRKFKNFMLHSKVVIVMTGLLLVLGTVLLLIFEADNTLNGMNFFQRIGNSFFHSATPRTAGFNTLPTGDLQEHSQLLTILLMFIGAGSGSTAGGIKVTTFAIIIFAIMAYFKGEEEVNMHKRRINLLVIRKAFTIFFIGLSVVFVTTFVLLLTQAGNFGECLFEAVSAFGTVGLSTGITPTLPTLGKMMITLTMFVGRLGPLSLAVSLTALAAKKPYTYPEGKINVG